MPTQKLLAVNLPTVSQDLLSHALPILLQLFQLLRTAYRVMDQRVLPHKIVPVLFPLGTLLSAHRVRQVSEDVLGTRSHGFQGVFHRPYVEVLQDASFHDFILLAGH